MIDFVKLRVFGITAKELISNPLLKFYTPVEEATGDLKNFKIAVYQHLEFKITNDRYIDISGSLHKHWNNGSNDNDFTFNDLFYTIRTLCLKFNFNPHFVNIHNIEFAVNLNPAINASEFIKQVISYKGEAYSKETFNKRGYLIRFEKQQYEIKIYDKGLQYERPYNILRIETKVTTMQYLSKIGIKTLADQLDPDKLTQLGLKLTSTFNELLIYDNSIDLKKINARDQTILREGYNPKYWEDLKESNPANFIKKRQRFRVLVKKYGTKNLQESVSNLISNKWIELLKVNDKTNAELDKFLSRYESKTFLELSSKAKHNFPRINTSVNRLNQGNIIPTIKQ